MREASHAEGGGRVSSDQGKADCFENRARPAAFFVPTFPQKAAEKFVLDRYDALLVTDRVCVRDDGAQETKCIQEEAGRKEAQVRLYYCVHHEAVGPYEGHRRGGVRQKTGRYARVVQQ